MPLTRFPDHEEKRVYLSTILSFDLPPPDTAHSSRISVAVFWIDRESAAARELSLDFAIDMIEHGALALVFGGSAAEDAAACFEDAIAEGEFVRLPEEDIEIHALPEASVEDLLWTAAEEAMPSDAYADQPWDIVVWAKSGDPAIVQFRQTLPRLSQIVDERYDLGGEDDR